jgi:hypothetical protein
MLTHRIKLFDFPCVFNNIDCSYFLFGWVGIFGRTWIIINITIWLAWSYNLIKEIDLFFFFSCVIREGSTIYNHSLFKFFNDKIAGLNILYILCHILIYNITNNNFSTVFLFVSGANQIWWIKFWCCKCLFLLDGNQNEVKSA